MPRHLKIAHEKARAITGRFLGLMRAEVDKIALFYHSRIGDLTDTIGSLRFPSESDGMGYYGDDVGGASSGHHLEHPLSDGGLHPSASSSSEDISLSSGEDGGMGHHGHHSNAVTSRGRNDHYMRTNIHANANVHSPLFHHQVGRTGRRNSAPNQRPGEWMDHVGGNGRGGFDDDAIQSTAFRQLQLAEELRLSRPVFQRSDQVLGEDFLLLSAVDEADAFTAVGVEFIHLLRYIFVNAIAIRKLCKKHDSLLSSRMLGGYYHKLNRGEESGNAFMDAHGGYDIHTPDLKGTPKRKNTTHRRRRKRSRLLDFGIPLPTHSSTIQSPRGKYKLVGVHDSRVQNLANSLSSSTLSDSLCLALSEFEVSRRRADRLSSFHPDMHKSTGFTNESMTDLVSLGADDLCHGFPSPKTFGFAAKKPEHFRDGTGDLSGDDKSDAPSTSSNISLTRLRFVVTSVITLRNAGIERKNLFVEFLTRSSVTVDERGFVGEPFGLSGCSRETLDFFVSYNPDYALILECHILQEALSNEDHFLSLSYLLQAPCNLKHHDGTSTIKDSPSVRSVTESIVSSSVTPAKLGKPVVSEPHQLTYQLNIASVILSTVSINFHSIRICKCITKLTTLSR